MEIGAPKRELIIADPLYLHPNLGYFNRIFLNETYELTTDGKTHYK